MLVKSEQKSPIQVIERMMKLLEVLAQHPEPLGLKQISQYAGLHPSTAHRILSAMAADRLVDRVEPGAYRIMVGRSSRDIRLRGRVEVGGGGP